MQFTLGQRMVLFGMLSNVKGDLKTVRAVKKFKDELVISQEEMETVGFKTLGNGTFSWDPEKDEAVEIETPDLVVAAVNKKLDELIKANEMQEYHLNVYDLFHPEPENA